MVNCVIVTAGEKIKNLREKYKVKQEDIAGSDITRNLISEIEHNKVKVTRNTAEVILKHLNKLAAERGFNIEETVDYLVEDELSQASNILDEFIEELKTLSVYKDNSFISTLDEAENFLINWDIKDKKIAIYELAGDYFCTKDDMYKSVVYYEKALALIGKVFLNNSLLKVLRKLSMTYGYIGRYKESIECCNLALSRFDDMSVKDTVIFRYNNALAYFYINNFERSLENIQIAEKLVDRSNVLKLFEILNSKAVCLCSIKHYDEALQVFNELLSLVKDNYMDRYITVLLNMVNIYLDMENKDKALENFKPAAKIINSINNDSPYLPEIYFHMGKFYKSFGNEKKSDQFYLRSLDFCEKQKNYVLENDVLSDLIEMYTFKSEIEKMDSIKYKVFSLFSKQGYINHMLVHKLVSFYIDNNTGTAKELTDLVLKSN